MQCVGMHRQPAFCSNISSSICRSKNVSINLPRPPLYPTVADIAIFPHGIGDTIAVSRHGLFSKLLQSSSIDIFQVIVFNIAACDLIKSYQEPEKLCCRVLRFVSIPHRSDMNHTYEKAVLLSYFTLRRNSSCYLC